VASNYFVGRTTGSRTFYSVSRFWTNRGAADTKMEPKLEGVAGEASVGYSPATLVCQRPARGKGSAQQTDFRIIRFPWRS